MKDDKQKKPIDGDVTSDSTVSEPIETENEIVDDVVFEEEGETAKDTIKKLREKLKMAELAKMEYLESMQRMKADYVNAKKRDDESKMELVKYANVNFAEELLPTLDSFEQAMADKEQWESVSKEWRDGIESIYGKVLAVFNKNNINAFGSIGDVFDPNIHHSIQLTHTDDIKQDGTVSSVLQKGYKSGDKIIRPAMVSVFEAGEK